MEQKKYTKPAMKIVRLKQRVSLLGGSTNPGSNPPYDGPVGYANPYQDPKA